EGALSWGIFGTGDKNKTTVLNIPQFILNKTVFDDIVATTTNSDSKIGNKIFKYGKTTMDYKRKRFYFEPYKNVSRAKLSQRPWSLVPVFKDEKLVVGIIWDKQLENQVNLGDEIINIDGIDYSSIPFCDLIKSDFKTEKDDITTIILKDIHTGKIKEIKI